MAYSGYWERPVGVLIRSRFHSGTYMFDTVEEAIAYVCQQWQNAKADAKRFPSYSGIESDFHAEFTTFPSAIPAFLFDLDALKR